MLRPRSDAPVRRAAAPTASTQNTNPYREKYSPCQQKLQVLYFAAVLDRHADALLFMGLHAAAERFSNQAEELRAVSV